MTQPLACQDVVPPLNTAATEQAFAALLSAHAGMVLATCRRILAQDLAEDAVQETFLQALRTPPPPGACVGAWLHRVAVNKAIDLSRREVALGDRQSRVRPGPPSEPSWHLGGMVDEALGALPGPSRELLVEHHLNGVSQRHIAQRLGISQASVSRRLRDAGSALRQELGRQGVSVDASVLAGCLMELGPSQLSHHLAARLRRLPGQAGLHPALPLPGFLAGGALLLGVTAALLIALGATLAVGGIASPRDPAAPPAGPPVADASADAAPAPAHPRPAAIEVDFSDVPTFLAVRMLHDAQPAGDEVLTGSAPWKVSQTLLTWHPDAPVSVDAALSRLAGNVHGQWQHTARGLALTVPMGSVLQEQWRESLMAAAGAVGGGSAAIQARIEALVVPAQADGQALHDYLTLALARDPARAQRLLPLASRLNLLNGGWFWNGYDDAIVSIPVDAALRAAITAAITAPVDPRQQVLALKLAEELPLTATRSAVRALLADGVVRRSLSPTTLEAIETLAELGDGSDLPALDAALGLAPTEDAVLACATTLARLDDAQARERARRLRADPRLSADGRRALARILCLGPQALARPDVWAMLADPAIPMPSKDVALAALMRWGNPADQAQLLTLAEGLSGPVSPSLAQAIGRLAAPGSLASLAQLLARHPRWKDADGTWTTAAEQLGEGLSGCPDPVLWSAIADAAQTSTDPAVVTLAGAALAHAHRPSASRAMAAALRARAGQPGLAVLLAIQAAALDQPVVERLVLGFIDDARLPLAVRGQIIAHCRAPVLADEIYRRGYDLRHDRLFGRILWANIHEMGSAPSLQLQRATVLDLTADPVIRGLALNLDTTLSLTELVALSADDSAYVRSWALYRLMQVNAGCEGAAAAAMQCLAHDPSSAVRTMAAGVLGMIASRIDRDLRSRVALLMVHTIAEDADADTRLAAARSAMLLVEYSKITPSQPDAQLMQQLQLLRDRPAISQALRSAIDDSIQGRSLPMNDVPIESYSTCGVDMANHQWSYVVLPPTPEISEERSMPIGHG